MINLLPKLSEEVTKTEKSKLSYWNPANADPAKAKISAVLEQTFTVDVESSIKYKENTLPKSEPNFVPRSEVERLDPSQISEETRGIPDDPVISTQMFIDAKREEAAAKPRPPKIILDEMAKLLRVKVYNYMKYHRLELFLQSQAKIANASLKPFRDYTRILDGQLPSTATVTPGGFGEEGEREGDLLYFYCGSAARATVTSTNRQEIKDYRFFASKRIGLEVELVSHKLVVSKVLPETQAFVYEKMLDGAEIVAINGERVVDLEEFQAAMIKAKKHVFVTLTIASYPEGRQKIDDLYQQNLDKSNQMKSLFSNLMGSIEDERRLQGGGSIGGGGVNPRRSSMLFADDDDDDDDDEPGPTNQKENHNQKEESPRRQSASSPGGGQGGGRRSAAGTPSHGRRASSSSVVAVAASPQSARSPRRSTTSKRRSKLQSPSSDSRDGGDRDSREKTERRTSGRSSGGRNSKRESSTSPETNKREAVEQSRSVSRSGDFTETDTETEDFQTILRTTTTSDDPLLFAFPEPVREASSRLEIETDEAEEGMIAGKTLVERTDELSVREEPPPLRPSAIATNEVNEEENDESSVEDWNILTKLDGGGPPEVAVYSFSTLVGMPSPFLAHSKHWGHPKYHLQFSNFSSGWRMEIYWIDEKGVLVPRGSHDLLQGDTHYELFSAAHVWAVIATPLRNPLVAGSTSVLSKTVNSSVLVNRSSVELTNASSGVVNHEGSLSPVPEGGGGGGPTALEDPSLEAQNHSLSTSLVAAPPPPASSSTEMSQLMCVFRPSKACCSQETKCLSVLWSPGQSLTISQLLYSKPVKSTHRSYVPVNRHKEERIKPSIHIQLFESPLPKPPPVVNSNSNSNHHNPPHPASPGSGTGVVAGGGGGPFPPLRGDSRGGREEEEEELGKLTRKPLRSTRALSRLTINNKK